MGRAARKSAGDRPILDLRPRARPWVAYSWLFEILAFGIFRAFGLVGIWVFLAVMVYAVAIALHRLLVSRGRGTSELSACWRPRSSHF